jgi:hypothetical protein
MKIVVMNSPRKARITIVNAPGDLSSLKVPGWIKSEATSVQSNCGPDDFVIIRVFLTTAQVSGLGQRKVDKILKGLTDNHRNIYRVELTVSPSELSFEEIQEEVLGANEALAAMTNPKMKPRTTTRFTDHGKRTP